MRHKGMLRATVCALLACASHGAAAQALTEPVTTYLQGKAATARPGVEYRKDIATLQTRLDSMDAADIALLDRIIAHCGTWQRPGLRVVSVADVHEYEAYMAAHDDGLPTEWIDLSCANALQMRGFAAAAQRQWSEALVWLDQAIALGPYLFSAYTERGYALRNLGRTDEALASYRQALALADVSPRARAGRAIALRGIGSLLIDTPDKAGARAALQQSLELEPGNAVALHELQYLDHMEAAASPPH